MTTSKPTLGRIVIFNDEGGVQHAAIVSKVWSETCVNLHFFDGDSGSVQFRTSRALGTGEPGTWGWPVRA